MKFKNYIETESGIKDTSTSPGTAGQVLSSTVAGTSWIDQGEIIAAAATLVTIECKNTHTTPLTKGTPVYQTGTVGATDVIEIAPGSALVSSGAQPSIGLLQQDLAINEFGYVVITGELLNITTDPIDGLTPVTGQKVFVKSGGGLTLTKPTTELNSIQNMGLVGKVSNGNAGSITVSSIMRTNDVPNLPTGKIWVGDGNTIVSDTVFLDEPNGRMGIGTNNPQITLDVVGRGRFVDSTGTVNICSSTYIPLLITNTGGYAHARINGFEVGGNSIANNEGYIKTSDNSRKLILDTSGWRFLAQNAELMRIDSNGKVGIGTTNPGDKLHVSAGAIRLDDFYQLRWGGTGTGIYGHSTQGLNFYTDAGTTRLKIEDGGNVGIGTTSPQAKLEVGHGDINIGSALPTVGALSNKLNFWGYTAGQGVCASIGSYRGSNYVSGGLIFETGELTTSEKMRITPAGSVGIGTTSFFGKLSVKESGSGVYFTRNSGDNGTTGPVLAFANDSTKSIIAAAGDGIIFRTRTVGGAAFSGSETMRITSGGNVGIGTTTPTAPLHIEGGTNSEVLKIEADVNPYIRWVQNGTNVGFLQFNGGSAYLSNMANGSLFFRTNNTDKMTILSGGNVGIGTTSPGFKLDLGNSENTNNLFRSNGLYSDVLFSGNVSAPTGGVGLWNFINTGTNATTRFYVQDANNLDSRLTFDFKGNGGAIDILSGTSSGNVGIGTTSPVNRLDVVGISRFTHSSSTSYRGAIETVVDNAYPTWDIGWLHARTSSSTYGNIARFNDQNGSQIGGIFYSGSSGTSFVTTSDYRLKENIEEISDSISRVKKLKPCRFNFTAEKNRVVDGFIAHEVQKVVPEAVHGKKDALQEDGSIDAQTLEVSRLIPVLTKALQEAIIKIEELELRVQTIENN